MLNIQVMSISVEYHSPRGLTHKRSMVQQLLQLSPGQDRTKDQLRDIHTSFIREEQKHAAGNYFTERVTNVWNSLPSYIVKAPNIEEFERRLDWRDQDIIYNYEVTLSLGPLRPRWK